MAGSSRPRRLKRTLGVLAVLVLVVGAGLFGLVQWRLGQEREGLGHVLAPSTPETLDAAAGTTGRFSAHVEYTSMAAPADARVSTEVAWDDDRFFEDPTEYNHELATTCSVLSAIANSESQYYQAGSGAPAYMENALAALGFTDVSTASYEYRSEVLDEVVNFLTNSNDVTAYTVASKRVTSSKSGKTKTLLLVSVRGSYGSEWISDANMGNPADLELLEGDHEGFAEPAQEIIEQLQARVTQLSEQGATTDDVALLFCGHSRGGATANVAAAYADDWADSPRPLATASSIWCYAFAVPRCTGMSNARDAMYDNIFNVLNPSDIVPRLPLASWGFDRYGRDLWLPTQGTAAFEASYDEMRRRFEENVGVESPYDPGDVATVDDFERKTERDIPTKEGLASVGGMAALLKSLAMDMDVARVLYGHYPNTYIAWMQAIDANDLATER